MGVSSKSGKFTLNSSTGNQSVTGLGFEPKCVLFLLDGGAADGAASDRRISWGGMCGATIATNGTTVRGPQFHRCLSGEDGQASSDNGGGVGINQVALFIDIVGTSASTHTAAGISLDSDGFTINVNKTNGTGKQIQYLALGGTDITDVAFLECDGSQPTGEFSYAGAGFQPDHILFIGSRTTDSGPGFGAANASGDQFFSKAYSENGKATTQVARYQSNARCYVTMNSGGIYSEASFVSMDSDGFTLDWITGQTNSAAGSIYAVCIKGGESSIGVATQKTSTGTDDITTTGVLPKALFISSSGHVSSSTANGGDMLQTVGMSDGTTDCTIWNSDKNGVETTVCKRHTDSTSVFRTYTVDGSTLNAEATVDSFASEKFTLDWTTADTTAREFGFFAFGEASGTPPATSIAPIATHLRRLMS